jgi:hypothetical protein
VISCQLVVPLRDGVPVFFPTVAPAGEEGEEGGGGAEGGGRGGNGDGDEGLRVFHIEQPPIRRWTHDAHKEFPGFFKQISRAFLLTHARLRRAADERSNTVRVFFGFWLLGSFVMTCALDHRLPTMTVTYEMHVLCY